MRWQPESDFAASRQPLVMNLFTMRRSPISDALCSYWRRGKQPLIPGCRAQSNPSRTRMDLSPANLDEGSQCEKGRHILSWLAP